MNKLSVITDAPSFTKGYVKEFRVRWALEEVGATYEEMRFLHKEIKTNDYLSKQPFGQIPYFENEGLSMFESGAIVTHLASTNEKLMPKAERERARALSWIFAALTSIEPAVANLQSIEIFNAKEEWAKLRRPKAREMVEMKLEQLSHWLGAREYLENEWSAGDLLMTCVLREVAHQDFMSKFPNLQNYIKRNEAREAFKRAMSAHAELYS